MKEHPRSLVGKLIQDLLQQRDELRVTLNLGSKEVKEQLAKLDDKLYQLRQQFEPTREAVDNSAEDVWDAMKLLGGEIKEGFDRVRKTL